MGISDKIRQGRVKVYCPKCDEVYVPQEKYKLDGAFFGPSLPQIFITAYKSSIVLAPKLYFYEPKLFGFNIATKRGSTYFVPPKETVSNLKERTAALPSKENLMEINKIKNEISGVKIEPERKSKKS